MSQEAFAELQQRTAQVLDLGGAQSLLSWDQHTHMPAKGAEVRAERMATLTMIMHQMATDPAVGDLIEKSESYAREQGEGSLEYACWRDIKRTYDRFTLIPMELAAEMTRASSKANQAWVQARKADDYASFEPFLARNLELTKQSVDHLRELHPDAGEDYDILLADYEWGITAAEIDRVFAAFREGARPLVAKVDALAGDGRDAILHGHFPTDQQEKLVRDVVHQLGFTDDAWDLTTTAHPFESSMAINDIRLTTKYDESFFNPSFFGTMHEFGHGLYEHQVDTRFERTVLSHGVSMAWHESQSRMWENLVGRGRPFWTWAMPKVQEAMPGAFDGVSAHDMYRAVNAMGPSLIRIEADELTYNYHIILRFELERELLAGKVTTKDLPEAWNARMKDYLGVDVPNNADGVLQDVHWSSGSFGYFPTYALGNILGAQLWQKITAEIPGLEDGFERGEFAPLREWLGENIHQYGGLYEPKDLMDKVLGTRELDAAPLLAYLDQKVADLYD